jgi:hypothetical protein
MHDASHLTLESRIASVPHSSGVAYSKPFASGTQSALWVCVRIVTLVAFDVPWSIFRDDKSGHFSQLIDCNEVTHEVEHPASWRPLTFLGQRDRDDQY